MCTRMPTLPLPRARSSIEKLQSNPGLGRFGLRVQRLGVSLQFSRAVEDTEIWNAIGDGFSFVISSESSTGPDLHGKTGFLATWCSIATTTPAVLARSASRSLAGRWDSNLQEDRYERQEIDQLR